MTAPSGQDLEILILLGIASCGVIAVAVILKRASLAALGCLLLMAALVTAGAPLMPV